MNNTEILLKAIHDISIENNVSYTEKDIQKDNKAEKWIIFEDLSMGFYSIAISLNNNGDAISLAIKGVNSDIIKMLEKANLNRKILNVSFKNYLVMDENKMIVTLIVIL